VATFVEGWWALTRAIEALSCTAGDGAHNSAPGGADDGAAQMTRGGLCEVRGCSEQKENQPCESHATLIE